eukprot:6187965-Pleurochrysis_carterae.AAC.3
MQQVLVRVWCRRVGQPLKVGLHHAKEGRNCSLVETCGQLTAAEWPSAGVEWEEDNVLPHMARPIYTKYGCKWREKEEEIYQKRLIPDAMLRLRQVPLTRCCKQGA